MFRPVAKPAMRLIVLDKNLGWFFVSWMQCLRGGLLYSTMYATIPEANVKPARRLIFLEPYPFDINADCPTDAKPAEGLIFSETRASMYPSHQACEEAYCPRLRRHVKIYINGRLNMLNETRYECRRCKQGPSVWRMWPIRSVNQFVSEIYCDRCGGNPVRVDEPEVVQTLWGRVEVPAERAAVA